MFNSIMNRSCWVVLLLSAHLASAQPTGQSVFVFSADETPVWDLSGAYVLNTPMQGAGDEPLPLSYGVSVDHQSKGKLFGEDIVLVNIGDETVAGVYTLRGSVSGGGDITRANFSVSIRGTDWISGAVRNFSISANYRLEIDPVEHALFGRVRGKVSISGVGGAQIRDDEFHLPLSEDVDGSWAIALDYLPFKSFVGAATISVSRQRPPELPPGWVSERVMPAQVKGSWSANTGLTKAKVSSVNPEAGSSVSLTFGDDDGVIKLSGKVLGQKVRAGQ